jgi:plastocyanin
VIAAVGTVATAVALGAAGSANGVAPATVYAIDNGGPCFANTSKAACDPGETAEVSINTGETVTWNFDPADAVHNAASTNDVPADPAWKDYAGAFVSEGSYSRTFNQPGTYEFRCDVHPVMTGTINVTGAPVETPTTTPSTTPTSTATSTPTTQPSDPGVTTPPPTGGAQDLVKPTLQSLGTTPRRRAVTVRFQLSENATVNVRVKRRTRVVKSVTKQFAAGRRAVSVRSSKLRRGRYKAEVRARDASGNVSTLAAKSFRIRR